MALTRALILCGFHIASGSDVESMIQLRDYAVCVVGAVRTMLRPDMVANFEKMVRDPVKGSRQGGDIFYYLYVGRELSSRGQYEGLTSAQAGAFAAALRGATQFQFQYEENNFTCGEMTTGRFYKQARYADMVSGYQMEHRLRYNVLIYTRPDLFYGAPLPSLIGLIRYSPLTFASFKYGDLVAMSGGALGLAMHLPNATCCNLTTRKPGRCFYGTVPRPNFIFERHFLSQGCARAKVPKWPSSLKRMSLPWFKHWNPGKFAGKFRSEVERRAVPHTSAVLSSIELIRAALPEGSGPG